MCGGGGFHVRITFSYSNLHDMKCVCLHLPCLRVQGVHVCACVCVRARARAYVCVCVRDLILILRESAHQNTIKAGHPSWTDVNNYDFSRCGLKKWC